MSMNRRSALKLGLSAGALPLLGPAPLLGEPEPAPGANGANALAAAAARPKEGTVQVRPLPLTAVRLTGGPLKDAQDADRRYLLQLEPDRMLAYYRERAGLKRKAEPYAGWDGGGRNLTGHVA